MTDAPSPDATRDGAASRPAPLETLSGDRLCMQCLHPLVGSPITRESQTGLLYVRCGECGTASALFEYPSFGPWLRRMKAVAGSTLIAIALVITLVVGGIALGFTTGASQAGSEAAGGALVERFRQLGGTADDTTWGGSMWGSADMKWIGTAEGAQALADVRWSLPSIMVVLGITTIGALVMAPFAAILGVVLMRRNTLERAAICALLIGAAAAIAVFLEFAFGASRGAPTWRSLAGEEHGAVYALVAAIALASTSAIVAAASPAIAAAIARFILPPRDRRLLAWLWEWRGKQVPRT
jgi:hypothetical protein